MQNSPKQSDTAKALLRKAVKRRVQVQVIRRIAKPLQSATARRSG